MAGYRIERQRVGDVDILRFWIGVQGFAVIELRIEDDSDTEHVDFMEKMLNIALSSLEKLARVAAFREAAEIVRKTFGGPHHKWASENADLYSAQDETILMAAAAIEARARELEGEAE